MQLRNIYRPGPRKNSGSDFVGLGRSNASLRASSLVDWVDRFYLGISHFGLDQYHCSWWTPLLSSDHHWRQAYEVRMDRLGIFTIVSGLTLAVWSGRARGKLVRFHIKLKFTASDMKTRRPRSHHLEYNAHGRLCCRPHPVIVCKLTLSKQILSLVSIVPLFFDKLWWTPIR